MVVIPQPRRPVCLKHTRWLAACSDCAAERRAARCPEHPVIVGDCPACAEALAARRQAARNRLDQAAR